jgi:hypothetical protein
MIKFLRLEVVSTLPSLQAGGPPPFGCPRRIIQYIRSYPPYIFGLKREEVTGEWRRLHHKGIYVLCSSSNSIRVIKSRRLRWAGHVARMRRRELQRAFVAKPEGRKPHARPRRKWEDNIKIDI